MKHKTVFTTSDGQEFEDQTDAERHEKLIAVKGKFEEAQQEYGITLAETQKTADGFPFELTSYRYYYWIEQYSVTAFIKEVYFYPRDFAVDFHEYLETDLVWVIDRAADGQGKRYRIDQLYLKPENAKRELFRVLNEQLQERTKALVTLSREFSGYGELQETISLLDDYRSELVGVIARLIIEQGE